MLLFVGGPEIILLVLLILIVIFIYKSFKSKNTSSRMMKKILRYLTNTILFVVIWCIPAFLFVGLSLSVNGTRPSGIAGAGAIIAIIISYRLVKRINKSNLWKDVFDYGNSEKELNSIQNSNNRNSSLRFRAIIGALIILFLSIVFIISSLKNGVSEGLIFLIPLFILFYWVGKGYFKKNSESMKH